VLGGVGGAVAVAIRSIRPRAAAASLIAAALALSPGPTGAIAGDAPSFEFLGVVQPMQKVTIASHLNGIVETVLFTPGAMVAVGDPLFRIDPKEFEIAVDSARAAVEEAQARLDLAIDAAGRETALLDRGTGSRVRAFEAEVERRVAEARLHAAGADLASAQLALDRTVINAPIAGRIGWPLVARGAFVEAEAGTAMAEIVQTDPVLVAYGVRPEVRSAALAASDGASVADMFAQLTVELVLPTGDVYRHPGQPRFDSATVDPETGMLTTWAEVPNPEGTLVPGLSVTVMSRRRAAEAGQ
jgi:membrane fusion protein, multidrug efflux system